MSKMILVWRVYREGNAKPIKEKSGRVDLDPKNPDALYPAISARDLMRDDIEADTLGYVELVRPNPTKTGAATVFESLFSYAGGGSFGKRRLLERYWVGNLRFELHIEPPTP